MKSEKLFVDGHKNRTNIENAARSNLYIVL